MNNYVQVLFESAWVATIIPMSAEPTFFAMRGFGGYDMWPAFAMAVAGATGGQLFNWGVGRLLLTLKDKGELNVSEPQYQKFSGIFRRYLLFLLVLCWVPLCNIFVVIAGFFNLRMRILIPLILLGNIIRYGQYML
jgi:membrane protein YqaA with SNARE-associated domain